MIDSSIKSIPDGLTKLNYFVFGISNFLMQARLYPPDRQNRSSHTLHKVSRRP
jgi:hypothetical protein